jgi:uncharacterized membrane protein YeaQ/YmgE (transglycosylase-associated protein family)
MNILWSILIGLVIGAFAKLFIPAREPGGVILTMFLGVAGALVAYLVGHSLGFYEGTGQTPGLVASILGSIFILCVYRLGKLDRGTT